MEHDKYKVVRLLGIGGMAEVFLCRQHGLGGFERLVVMKRIRSDIDQEHFIDMFLDEARVAASLSHVNVVQIFEVGEIEGRPHIVMEYVAGPQLSSILDQLQSNPGMVHLGHLAYLLAGAAEGLHHAHTACDGNGNHLQIVHRDVSPHNIIVSPDGVPKLFDFGVAKATSNSAMTSVGAIKGKVSYIAPEQLRTRPVNYAADVFALGVCLYEATVGCLPWRGETEAELFGARLDGYFPLPSEIVADYPPELEAIVLAAMSFDPAQRPDAATLADWLLAFAMAQGSNPRTVMEWLSKLFPATAFMPSPDGRSSEYAVAARATVPILRPRRGLVIGAACASVVAAAGGVYFYAPWFSESEPAAARAGATVTQRMASAEQPTVAQPTIAPGIASTTAEPPKRPSPPSHHREVSSRPPTIRPSSSHPIAHVQRVEAKPDPRSDVVSTRSDVAPDTVAETPPPPPPAPAKPTIDVAATRTAVIAQLAPIQQCYERAKMDDTSLRGTVTARMTVAANGSIANVSIVSSTLHSPPVEACVTREVAHWHLPKPDGGPVSFAYPFAFQ